MAKKWKVLTLALTMLVASSATGRQVVKTVDAVQNGWSLEQNRTGAWHLAQHRKLATAMAALKPQRPGVVDAYLIVIGLDSDAVFRHEAGETAKVLSRRYGATGRTIFLSAGADEKPVGTPQGSPPQLATALAAVAAKMDLKQDVLVLFATSHGDPVTGLAYRDGDQGVGVVAPTPFAEMLDGLGFTRRLIILSACYSGIFVPALSGEQTIVITAAASNRTSFGCQATNDWTFFGDALINNALRKPQPLDKAADEALALISMWEAKHGLTPSRPQVHFGEKATEWLTPLEARMPRVETARVGRPATDSM